MMISDLPVELQENIYSYVGVHPCAAILKTSMASHMEDHYIFRYDCMIYEARYRKPIWKAGRCKQCKRNGIKLYRFEKCKMCYPPCYEY